jgi:hypothetical protein
MVVMSAPVLGGEVALSPALSRKREREKNASHRERYDAVVDRTELDAFRRVVVSVTFGAGIGVDDVDAFLDADRRGGAVGFAICTSGAEVGNDFECHDVFLSGSRELRVER